MYAIAIQASDSVFTDGIELSNGSRARLGRADEVKCLLARGTMRQFVYDCLVGSGLDQVTKRFTLEVT